MDGFTQLFQVNAGRQPLSGIPGPRRLPTTVPGKDRDIPDRLIQIHIYKPAEQHAVVDFFHQQPLNANRVKRLDQLRAQQLLWRDRRPTGFGVYRANRSAML
jgi:hypothetical protein